MCMRLGYGVAFGHDWNDEMHASAQSPQPNDLSFSMIPIIDFIICAAPVGVS